MALAVKMNLNGVILQTLVVSIQLSPLTTKLSVRKAMASGAFFPSEDYSQLAVSYKPRRRSSDSDSSFELLEVDEARDEESASDELKDIGSVLISSCCDISCLHHLTALDVINS